MARPSLLYCIPPSSLRLHLNIFTWWSPIQLKCLHWYNLLFRWINTCWIIIKHGLQLLTQNLRIWNSPCLLRSPPYHDNTYFLVALFFFATHECCCLDTFHLRLRCSDAWFHNNTSLYAIALRDNWPSHPFCLCKWARFAVKSSNSIFVIYTSRGFRLQGRQYSKTESLGHLCWHPFSK